MPNIQVARVIKTLTADGGADGYAEFADNGGVYVGAKGYLRDALGTVQAVQVTALKDDDQAGLRFIPEDGSASYSYGMSDLSDFTVANTAKLFLPEQIVPSPSGAVDAEGLDTEVQFNNNSVFDGDAGLTYDKVLAKLTVGGGVSIGGGKFVVSSTGSITKLRDVTVLFPSANAAGVMSNDGTGVMEWNTAITLSGSSIGFYGAPAVAQYATEGTVTGFTAGSGTAVKHDSTFTGNVGTKAYTQGDIVKALKLSGLIAS